MVKIELTMVSETRATIAKVRITTTNGALLLGRVLEGQRGFQTQRLSFQLDALRAGEILPSEEDNCHRERTFYR